MKERRKQQMRSQWRDQAEDSLATSIAAGSMERMPPVQLPHRNERIERHDALFETRIESENNSP